MASHKGRSTFFDLYTILLMLSGVVLIRAGPTSIFFYAFIGPALLIARTIRARGANSRAAATAAAELARADQEIAGRQAY